MNISVGKDVISFYRFLNEVGGFSEGSRFPQRRRERWSGCMASEVSRHVVVPRVGFSRVGKGHPVRAEFLWGSAANILSKDFVSGDL